MDESLLDFKETKQNCKGPKSKQKSNKPKVKRITKCTTGQSDIRKVLEKNKNDLITYTKEFDNVCKKTGLDVDSEQLQLAIALSKSLQSEDADTSTSQSVNTQGRAAKIRATLKEYGFKVSDTKKITSKKLKKPKQYKLITATDEEKHQKIISKYSQILFECIDSSKLSCGYDKSDAPLYYIATNLQYEFMKDNKVFYIDNLIEKSSTSGSMLRDWAEIPGRPVSPVPIYFDKGLIDFNKMEYSQDELDVILSGTITCAKKIIATKHVESKKEIIDCETPKVLIENKEPNNVTCEQYNDNSYIIANNVKKELTDKSILSTLKTREIIDLESNENLTVTEQCRCYSPDIFEDESCIMEISKPLILSQGQKTKIFLDDVNCMDFTECVSSESQNINKTQLTSQNITKRKSNDFMEMTQCAVTVSQGIQEMKKIDLTQSPEDKSIAIETKHKYSIKVDSHSQKIDDNNKIAPVDYFECKDVDKKVPGVKDVTQNSIKGVNSAIKKEYHQESKYKNNVKEVEVVDILDGVQKIKDNIDLTQNSNKEYMDLTQSSKSSVSFDDLPEIKFDNSKPFCTDIDDTIIMEEKEYNNQLIFDLTEATEEPIEKNTLQRIDQESFCDDFIHDHSDGKNQCSSEVYADNSGYNNDHNYIDLSQSSNELPTRYNTSVNNIPKSSSLGKIDNDISIDYDDICEHTSDNNPHTENNSFNNDSSKSQITDDMDKVYSNNDLVSNSSQNSEVFNLTDKELNYSIHNSRYDIADDCNFDFGGISVMDGISGEISFKKSLYNRKSISSINSGSSKTLFAERDTVENSAESGDQHNTTSPRAIQDVYQINKGQIPIVTPNNSEYIIKTNEVTPMLDYESMTTPQRNKELDKYGLRPFKRKRAIQILTHLYNQTHPIVETYLDNDQSPSKKPRQDELSCSLQKKLLKTSKSPKKMGETNTNSKRDSPQKEKNVRKSKSPRKSCGNVRNENSPMKKGNNDLNMVCSYELTSEVPIIKTLYCTPDDWVFPKKEKAKIHSCQLPLHIAFHNYVSSRRGLREAILKYEPVNIDVIHKDLVSYGLRYDPKDLLRYLDKKCITVKTADNNARNKR